MAVLLQSLDSDDNLTNGIDINSTTRTNFALTGNLADKTDNDISTEITARGKTVKDNIQALTHLLTSTKAIASSTKIDLVPDAFSFTDLTNQALSSVVESAPITVAGIDIASPISISGGYYKIGSGAWTNEPSKVTNGQTVTLKGSNATVTNITLTIGGLSDTFAITTSIPNIYEPLSGATNVGPYTWVKMNFGEDINSSDINISKFSGATFSSCDYNTSTKSAICKLADGTKFADNTAYTITAPVRALAGYDKNVSISFTTGKVNNFPLLRTGQTLCYDSANNTITCTDGNALKDDGYYVSQGLGIARSFDRNATSGQETVKDNVTKLIWQDDSSAASVTATWANANSATCQSLNTSSFGGATDWRLPTIEELYTITNKGSYNPSKFTEFSNLNSRGYWSSTTFLSNLYNDSWYAVLTSASSTYTSKDYSFNVICVRAGQ